MRTTVSVDPVTLTNMQALQTMLRKREIMEQASSRAAFLIRNDEREQAAARGPRNRAERRAWPHRIPNPLGRC